METGGRGGSCAGARTVDPSSVRRIPLHLHALRLHSDRRRSVAGFDLAAGFRAAVGVELADGDQVLHCAFGGVFDGSLLGGEGERGGAEGRGTGWDGAGCCEVEAKAVFRIDRARLGVERISCVVVFWIAVSATGRTAKGEVI